jgi:hypothetical protein
MTKLGEGIYLFQKVVMNCDICIHDQVCELRHSKPSDCAHFQEKDGEK